MKQEAILRRFFANKLTSVVSNNRGQAVIEYILLLVIVVSLVLGMRGVFGSMNTFMSEIVGGYVSCLMEYGELPSLGVEDSDLKQHKEGDGKRCPLPSFSAVASFGGGASGGGANSTGGANSSGKGKNGDSTGKSDSASKSGKNSNKSGESDDSSQSGSGFNSKSSARSRANSSPYARGQISRFNASSTADNPEDLNDESKVKLLEDSSGGSGGETSGGRRSSRRSAFVRPKYKALTGKMAEDLQKKIRTPRKPGSTLLGEDEGYRLTVVKRNFTPPEVKPPPEDKPVEGFQFGNFLKWLIIAGIVIACVILFGGQVMNYSNSDS